MPKRDLTGIPARVLRDRLNGQVIMEYAYLFFCSDVYASSGAVSYTHLDVYKRQIYDYAGKRYSVQMPNDPGPTVQLQVAPVGATRQGVSTSGAATFAEPAILPPTSISTPPAVYPVYEQPVYYPPVRLNLGYGYWGGYGWHGRGR